MTGDGMHPLGVWLVCAEHAPNCMRIKDKAGTEHHSEAKSPPVTDAYRAGWAEIFGKREVGQA